MPSIFQTNLTSLTGNIIYSDRSWSIAPSAHQQNRLVLRVHKTTVINKTACMPCFSFIAGISRIVIGIFHTLAHLALAAIYRNKEHTYHALKGCCTILEGFIEIIPIAGLIYAWKTSPPTGPDSLKIPTPAAEHVFLVKIVPQPNPQP